MSAHRLIGNYVEKIINIKMEDKFINFPNIQNMVSIIIIRCWSDFSSLSSNSNR